MYIAMHCVNANNVVQDEICRFYGIHYDYMYKSCVISTDHQHHDFVMSMITRIFMIRSRQRLLRMADR